MKFRIKNNLKKNKKFLKHLEMLKTFNFNKKVSQATRDLQSKIALNRGPVSVETRKNRSINNNKSKKIIAHFAESNLIYR